VRDLGIRMDDFIAAGSTPGYSQNFTADALLTATYGNLSNPNLLWNVAALDSTGGTVLGGQRYLSTTNASVAQIGLTSNSLLTVGFKVVNDYVTATNGADLDFTTNKSSTATAADGYAYFGSGFMNNWQGKASFDSTAAVGDSLNFYKLQATTTFGLDKLSKNATGVVQFGNADGAASWTLASNGTLSYSAPAPAAVPLPAAVWLLGSGLIGMVGVARRKAAKSAA
jgi:hypothetical protein